MENGNWENWYSKLYSREHNFTSYMEQDTMNMGLCHHGMALPQVADGGKDSNMEGSCE
jgi:hypothetical protein